MSEWADNYSAVVQLQPGRYAGEVRNIHAGHVAQCGHSHTRRHLANACGREMLARLVRAA